MRTDIAVAAVLVIAAAVLTGCSSGARSTATATSSVDVLAVWRDFAVCARQHGVPALPDPQLDANGKVLFPGFMQMPEPSSVRAACSRILDRLPAAPRSDAAPTDIPALLRFAQCMRAHGMADWPDPKADGTFPSAQLPPVKTPAFIAADQACDSLNPDRGGHVYGS